MTLNRKLNPTEAEASPSRERGRRLPGTQMFCRVLPVLLALLALICSPQARAQGNPLTINSPAGIAGSYTPTATVSWAPIDSFSSLAGEVAYVGRGCPGDVYLANPAGKIALMDRGLCAVSAKVDRAARAGAIAVLLVMDGDSPFSFGQGDGSVFVPTLIITKTHGDLIKANLAAPVRVSMGLAAGTPGVQTLSADSLTLTSATVSGRVNANGVETAVHFEYGPDTSLGSSSLSQNIGSTPGTIAVSATLSGLTSGTYYYYRLVANGGGKTVNGSIRAFETSSLPVIWGPPSDTAVMAGESAWFSVYAGGTGPFSYQWEHDGSITVPFDAGSNYYELSTVRESDAGEYRVGVMNQFSAGVPVYSPVARLTVYPAVPPTVSAVTAVGIGTTGATLSGEVNSGGGKVTTYFEFGLTTAYGSTTPEVLNDVNSVDTMAVTGLAGITRDVYDASFYDNYNESYWNGGLVAALQPNTTYHYRLVAVSVGGTTLGTDRVFTTAPSSTHTVTNGDASGPGSLPDTVTQADLSDTIVFDPALHGQTLSLGRTLILQKWLNIVGPGADKLAITGDGSRRVISVSAGLGTVKISGLTIRDGRSPQGGSNGGGGAIYNNGDLELDHCVFSNNVAPRYRVYRGGAIWHQGSRLVMRNCQLTGNFAEGGGGALNNDSLLDSGSPDYRVPVTTIVSDCTFTGNRVMSDFGDFYFGQMTEIASGGGAIQSTRGIVIQNCVFIGNDNILGYQGGGAIYTTTPLYDYSGDSNAGGTSILNCTFRANHCGYAGGAIHNGPGLPMRVEGSTFVDNASEYVAGSMVNQGVLSVRNSTFSGNRSDDTGAITNWGGSVTILGCTLSGNQSNTGGNITNSDGEFSMGNALLDGQLSGSFVSLGHNIIGLGDGSMGWTAADLVGSSADPVDPVIGPLADNGGPTWTHALLAGSPAMNSGNNTLVDSPDDQRGAGFPRLYGNVDIGAYEVSDPFTVHSDVLFDLIQLRNGTTQPAVAQTLNSAIIKLSAAVAPSLWLDTYRLAPAAGHAVFTLDLAAVDILTGAGWGTMDPALLLGMADRIARAAREIAVTGIDDGALGGSPMEKALAMLAKGDAALARGNPAAEAIAHYQSAWKQSLKQSLKPRK